VVFLAHAEQAAEADDGEHDVVRGLVEDDVLDLADFLAGLVEDVSIDDFARADCRGVSGSGGHENFPPR
jgi:hypothetical protein